MMIPSTKMNDMIKRMIVITIFVNEDEQYRHEYFPKKVEIICNMLYKEYPTVEKYIIDRMVLEHSIKLFPPKKAYTYSYDDSNDDDRNNERKCKCDVM